jgi:hypothetical protein
MKWKEIRDRKTQGELVMASASDPVHLGEDITKRFTVLVSIARIVATHKWESPTWDELDEGGCSGFRWFAGVDRAVALLWTSVSIDPMRGKRRGGFWSSSEWTEDCKGMRSNCEMKDTQRSSLNLLHPPTRPLPKTTSSVAHGAQLALLL